MTNSDREKTEAATRALIEWALTHPTASVETAREWLDYMRLEVLPGPEVAAILEDVRRHTHLP